MSYLEEWNRIEQMIENHNISKSTVITSEKRQALALSHIARCLSVIADDIVGDCKECKEATDNICCENCLHCDKSTNEEPCLSCNGYYGNWKPKKDSLNYGGHLYRNCASCLHYYNSIYQEPCSSCSRSGSNWEPKKATDEKPCNNCTHSNDEDESSCLTCENGSKFTPFGLRRI